MSVDVDQLAVIRDDARRRIGNAPDETALEQLRVEILGKKGTLNAALRSLGTLPAQQPARAAAHAHPASIPMSSFYVEGHARMLRTPSSPVQIRFKQAHPPPIRIIAPGPVYRRDALDATRGSQFHQVEALCVDRDIRPSDLKGTIEYFARSLFGVDRRIRIVGDHFPFTEPRIGAAGSCRIR